MLTMPARPERIFGYLFQEAAWFSSWGFLLLGSPMLVASGVVAHAPWYYYALLPPFMIAFVLIPVAMGGIVCLLLVDRMGRFRRFAARAAAIAVLVGIGWFGWSVVNGAKSDLMTPHWFQELSGRLQITENRWFPSWWLSLGLLEAMRHPAYTAPDYHPWAQSVMFLTLLISNALFFHQVATWLAGRVYRSSYSRMHSQRPARRRAGTSWFDGLLQGRGPRPPSPVRLLLVKELRLFRRDPVQLSQFLIFFGLLTLYFVNIRRFNYNPGYSAMIGFLNLAVVGLILSTFTTRFIFPMSVSLEGAAVLDSWPAAGESRHNPAHEIRLRGGDFVDPLLRADVHERHAAGNQPRHCAGASDFWRGSVRRAIGWQIAVGLGAKMPEMRELSPSKIAAGFGGTLNLVLSAMYIVAITVLTAVPYHCRLIVRQSASTMLAGRWTVVLGSTWFIVGGVIANRAALAPSPPFGRSGSALPRFRKLDPVKGAAPYY